MDFDKAKKVQEIQETIDNLKNGLKPDDRISGKLVIGFCNSLILSLGYVRAALSTPAPVDIETMQKEPGRVVAGVITEMENEIHLQRKMERPYIADRLSYYISRLIAGQAEKKGE